MASKGMWERSTNLLKADTQKLNSLPKGIGGKGWRGDKNWKNAVAKVKDGGDILEINGVVPTQQEALDLIKEAKCKDFRIEGPHKYPNPHNFPHINYTASNGSKGTIKIKE